MTGPAPAPTPNQSPPDRADVVVVGLGAWGSTALWRLAARGIRAVGIEQHQVGHALGSTHGTTRLFREACLEHPGLGVVAGRARELWRDLESASGTELLRLSGGLMSGPADGRVVAGSRAAAAEAGLVTTDLTSAEAKERFPAYAHLPEDHVGMWDPGAGIARPEAGVRAAVEAAQALGARVLTGTRVTDIEETGDGVGVGLAGGGRILADRVIVTAGAWTTRLLEMPLRPRRVPMFWFRGRDAHALADDLALDRFPVFIRELPDGRVLWGHGADERSGFAVKIGLDDDGGDSLGFADADPDHLDRAINLPRDAAALSAAVGEAFDLVDPQPVEAVACMYTRAPDGLFHVGALPGRGRIVVGAGDSGHGHKHAPAIGELLAQVATGEPTFTPIDYLAPSR
jgi:sarcosine oxidase